ncbi:hypothetical protein K4H28_16330 [Deefgea tanakiae]|jgi:hypothetical protein|uniref:Uncharacterized protein n=1 Tax=Deefgea tanakiae TaxID=2865840 RepID=A0ABX8Z7R3_9NEIS|nr:hypothetical protein [Deefgea tanakiae]QZA77810.1 hypothetical protein K4H28_16330 [Deefgea tanakiae]
MKSVKFLQRAQGFADYVVQTSSELTASLPQSDLYSRNPSTNIRKKKLSVGLWDGAERRTHQERRGSDRRNERQSAMLDTRVRVDRRREGRRQTDELELRSFSCRV